MFENYKLEDFLYHIKKGWKLFLLVFILVFAMAFGFLKLTNKVTSEKTSQLNAAFTLKAIEESSIYTNDGYQRSVGNTIKLNYEFIKSGIFNELVYNDLKSNHGEKYVVENFGKDAISLKNVITTKDNASTELLLVEIKTGTQDNSDNVLTSIKTVLNKLEINSAFRLITVGTSSTLTNEATGGMKMIHYIGVVFVSMFAGLFVIFVLNFFNPTINYENRLSFSRFGNVKNFDKTLNNLNYYLNKNGINAVSVVSVEKNPILNKFVFDKVQSSHHENYFKDGQALESIQNSKNVLLVVRLGKTTYNDIELLTNEFNNRDINIIGVVYN